MNNEAIWTYVAADDTYDIVAPCLARGCENVTHANVLSEELRAWRNGEYVQVAFRNLTDEQREAVFLTGICKGCWDDMALDPDDF